MPRDLKLTTLAPTPFVSAHNHCCVRLRGKSPTTRHPRDSEGGKGKALYAKAHIHTYILFYSLYLSKPYVPMVLTADESVGAVTAGYEIAADGSTAQ